MRFDTLFLLVIRMPQPYDPEGQSAAGCVEITFLVFNSIALLFTVMQGGRLLTVCAIIVYARSSPRRLAVEARLLSQDELAVAHLARMT